MVTSDKCYEHGIERPYRDRPARRPRPLQLEQGLRGDRDRGVRRSFLRRGAAIATARAGNVVGAGTGVRTACCPTSSGRCGRRSVILRNPDAIRPWQFVLEPLRGYLVLGERLGAAKRTLPTRGISGRGLRISSRPSWRSGWSVYGAAESCKCASNAGSYPKRTYSGSTGARRTSLLGWRPLLSLPETIRMTVEGYRVCLQSPSNAAAMMTQQISAYMTLDPA